MKFFFPESSITRFSAPVSYVVIYPLSMQFLLSVLTSTAVVAILLLLHHAADALEVGRSGSDAHKKKTFMFKSNGDVRNSVSQIYWFLIIILKDLYIYIYTAECVQVKHRISVTILLSPISGRELKIVISELFFLFF